MAVEFTAQAWACDIDSTKKLVLVRLADFANREGICWPTLGRVAFECALSYSTVKQAVNWLRQAGALVPVYREGGGRRRSVVYQLNLEVLPKLGEYAGSGGSHPWSDGRKKPRESAPALFRMR